MCKLVFVSVFVLLTSCASPKYAYYFDSHESYQNDAPSLSSVNTMSPIASTDLSNTDFEFASHEHLMAVIDTTILSNDSVSVQKQETNTKKKIYEEKKKEKVEASDGRASKKSKKLNGFAIAGPILLTVAFLVGASPVAFIFFGTLGLIATIVGFKSKLWGLSLATMIALGVLIIVSVYYYLLMSTTVD